MSETTEGVELAVPDEAITALAQWDAGTQVPHVEKGHLPTVVRAIASPVVAAELRRLADHYADDARYDGGIEYVREGLRARADELEAQS